MPDEAPPRLHLAGSSCLYLTEGLVSSQDVGLVGGARKVVLPPDEAPPRLAVTRLVVPLSNRLSCELTGRLLVRRCEEGNSVARRGPPRMQSSMLVVPLSNRYACELTGRPVSRRCEEGRGYGPTRHLLGLLLQPSSCLYPSRRPVGRFTSSAQFRFRHHTTT